MQENPANLAAPDLAAHFMAFAERGFSDHFSMALGIGYQLQQLKRKEGHLQFHQIPINLVGNYTLQRFKLGMGLQAVHLVDVQAIKASFSLDHTEQLQASYLVSLKYALNDKIDLGAQYTQNISPVGTYYQEVDYFLSNMVATVGYKF